MFDGKIKGIWVGRSGLFLTHLFFANDNILFREANLDGLNAIKTIVVEYEGGVGTIDNVPSGIRQIGEVLGVRISFNPEKYLSLPTMVGKQKEAFASCKDRFAKRIESWSVRQL